MLGIFIILWNLNCQFLDHNTLLKSDNLQYNTLVRWANGTNQWSTKCLKFQLYWQDFCKEFCKILWKKIILGTSDDWSTSRLFHRRREPAYYIVDCRISYVSFWRKKRSKENANVFLHLVPFSVDIVAWAIWPIFMRTRKTGDKVII